jgi:hypothetical protein
LVMPANDASARLRVDESGAPLVSAAFSALKDWKE